MGKLIYIISINIPFDEKISSLIARFSYTCFDIVTLASREVKSDLFFIFFGCSHELIVNYISMIPQVKN